MAQPRPTTHLTVAALLPSGRVGGFVRAVVGPANWFAPEGCMRPLRLTLDALGHGGVFPGARPSAHAQMAYQAFLLDAMGGRTRAAWGQERDRRWGRPLPAWMPVTDGCILRMALDPTWPAPVGAAPFAIPHLIPLDHALFTSFYGDPKGWANGATPASHQGFFPALMERVQQDLLGQSTPYTPVGTKPVVHGLSDVEHSAAIFRFRTEAKPSHMLAIAQTALARALDGVGLARHMGVVCAVGGGGHGEWSVRTPGGRSPESKLRGLFAAAPGTTVTGALHQGTHDLAGVLAVLSQAPKADARLLHETLSLLASE